MLARSRPRPMTAVPITSMSGSNPSSFARWSRVSGMSSTIRTRIRSAIEINRFQSAGEADSLGLSTVAPRSGEAGYH